MLKGIMIRIYPNEAQKTYIGQLLGCSRLVYNTCLAWRKNAYETDKKSLSSSDVSRKITELKNEKTFLRDVHSKVLQQSVRDLDTAFTNFFRNAKQNKKSGYPKFKKKGSHNDSCRFPKDAFIGIKGNRISLIRSLSDILYKCSARDERYINRHQDCVHSVTLRRNPCGQYYLSLLIDYAPKKLKKTDCRVGIDLGIKHLVITSDGEFFDGVDNSGIEKRLHCLQRQFAKTKNGSARHEELRKRIARKYLKLKNRRSDRMQKITTYLINENQVIGMEDLNAKGMLRNHKLAKSISEACFGEMRRMMEYKAEMYGRNLVFVGRFYPSSKTCHNCGYIKNDLHLSDREWTCPKCGERYDRDINAAVNILAEAERKIGLSSPEFTHVEKPTMDDKECIIPLKSSVSLNREKNVFQ